MKNFPSPPPPPPEEEEEVNGRRGSFLFFRAKYLRKICRWKKKGAGTITCGEKGESWWRSFSENSELLRKETGGGGKFPWGDRKEGGGNERRRRREKRLWVACNKFGPFSSTSLLVPFSPRSCWFFHYSGWRGWKNARRTSSFCVNLHFRFFFSKINESWFVFCQSYDAIVAIRNEDYKLNA